MSTTTRPPTIPPRVIEHEAYGGRSRPAFRMPEHSVRGLLAGAEAAGFGWLVLVIPAVAAYVATAASPALGEAGWLEAARIGTAAWLLGHGALVQVAGFQLSLVPLGVTALAVFLMSAAVRRAQLTGWTALMVAAGTYVAGTGLLVAFAGVDGGARALGGALAVAVVGSLLGQRGRYPRLPAGPARALDHIPDAFVLGLRAGVRILVALVLVALVAVVAAVVISFEAILELHAGLHTDGVSTVVAVFAQLLLLPTLMMWALAYLAGPGFAVGEGTAFTPSGIDAGPLPVVPVLGALPEPGSLLGELGIVVVLGVLVGAAAGWWLHRAAPTAGLLGSLAAVVVAATLTAAVVGAAVVAGSGGIGPGRMAVVGAEALPVAVAVGWQTLLGAGAVVTLSHPATARAVGWIRTTVRSWWGEVRPDERP
ncbi:hypothetical protein EXU48_05220 [Occultella glacieicola]|uniref:Uncharacterized protein n=1 Tax=Occultella glacieicola TaxID=2518684 RepID=A0ABY2E9D1_9MICO|nr:DUF6350 family protein [Occultella glacieicola]TDE97583.1 hypothetical protein EXU48_05220 [Occultella glacieicola]